MSQTELAILILIFLIIIPTLINTIMSIIYLINKKRNKMNLYMTVNNLSLIATLYMLIITPAIENIAFSNVFYGGPLLVLLGVFAFWTIFIFDANDKNDDYLKK